MNDLVPILFLLLILWLVSLVDSSDPRPGPEPPLLPQHGDNVRHTGLSNQGLRPQPPLPPQHRPNVGDTEGVNETRSRFEPPLLPQHRGDVRYTVTLRDVEQRSVREHQRRSVPPTEAPYVYLERERNPSPEPVEAIQPSVAAVSQNQNQTPLRTLPQQVNQRAQSPVLVPPVVPRREPIQIHYATEAPSALNDLGGVQLPGVEGSGNDYDILRDCAKQEIKVIRKYRQEKKHAKASGESTLVRKLTEQIRMHRKRRQLFDERASSLIFAKNNKDGSLDRIDLHGLTAKEAATRAKCAINIAREGGITKMRLIVGKGLHSHGPAVLKPRMLKLMQKLKLPVEVNPSNEGVLVVELIPSSNGAPPVVQDLTPLQPSLPQASQFLPNPLLPQVCVSPTGSDEWIEYACRERVQNCQGMSQLPSNTARNIAVLREQGMQERERMVEYLKGKGSAQARGERALANELAKKAKEHSKRSDILNAQAGELIFADNNKECPVDQVVLHDLKVKEVKTYLKCVIEEARANGRTEIRLVVNKGPYHPRVPAYIPKFLKRCGLSVEVNPTDRGVLIAKLNPGSA